MKHIPYRRAKAIAPSMPSPLAFAFDDTPQPSSRVENESWLVSYLDVFLLIIALLVIMLIKSPAPSIVTEPSHTTEPSVPDLSDTIRKLSADHRITVASNSKHISLRLDESLMFDSSKALIKPEGKAAIQLLIPALKRLNRPLVIEGHTDNTPINTLLYPSNWELSAARANSVLHYLTAQGIPSDQLSTANYADTRPLVPNDTHINRSINRRVNLLIQVEEDISNSDIKR